jgi:hypothetical protein
MGGEKFRAVALYATNVEIMQISKKNWQYSCSYEKTSHELCELLRNISLA